MRVDPTGDMAKSTKRPVAANANDSSRLDRQTSSAFSSSGVGAYDRDRVATRAYELYMARGRSDGRDLEDWLIAEREYRSDGDSKAHDE